MNHQSPEPCRMVEELIEEYTLDILDEHHRKMVDRHLPSCPACLALVDDYRRVGTALALSCQQVSPPQYLERALMARIANIPQNSKSATPYRGDTDIFRSPSLPVSRPVPQMPPMAPTEQPSSWWRVYAAPLATLPLLLALGLVAAWGFGNYSQLNRSQQQLEQRDLQIARLSSQLSNENNQGVASLVVSPSAKRYALSSDTTVGAESAQGTLFADLESHQAALQVSGLSAGTYAVVLQLQNGAMIPTTEFMVGPEGAATTLLDLGVQVSDLRSIHIRPATITTETDVAVVSAQPDVLMTTIGPDISDDSDTSAQRP